MALQSKPAKIFIFASLMTSCLINILSLTGPVFMIFTIDRVLSVKSESILLSFAILAAFAYLMMGLLEYCRQNMLKSYAHMFVGKKNDLADMWVSGGSVTFFDLPWIVIFLIFIFFLNGYLALIALLAIAMHVVAVMKSARLHDKIEAIKKVVAKSRVQYEKVLFASGQLFPGDPSLRFGKNLLDKSNQKKLEDIFDTKCKINSLAASMQIIRMTLVSSVIAVGAYLSVNGQLSAGSIVAGSILFQRCLAPLVRLMHTSSQVKKILNLIMDVEQYSDEGNVLDVLKETSPTEKRMNTVGVMIDKMVIYSANNLPLFQIESLNLTSGTVAVAYGSHSSGKTVFLQGLSHILKSKKKSFSVGGCLIDQKNAEESSSLIHHCPGNKVDVAIIKFFFDEMSEAKKKDAAAFSHYIEALNISEGVLINCKEKIIKDINEVNRLPYTLLRKIMFLRALSSSSVLITIDDLDHAFSDNERKEAVKLLHYKAKNDHCVIVFSSEEKSMAKEADVVLHISNGRIKNLSRNVDSPFLKKVETS